MPTDKTERLNGILAALNQYIDVVRAYDMEETAALLRMAKLDLQMHIHGISEEELQTLCETLEAGQAAPAPALADRNGNGNGHGLTHTHASLVLPESPIADRILFEAARAPKRGRRM